MSNEKRARIETPEHLDRRQHALIRLGVLLRLGVLRAVLHPEQAEYSIY